MCVCVCVCVPVAMCVCVKRSVILSEQSRICLTHINTHTHTHINTNKQTNINLVISAMFSFWRPWRSHVASSVSGISSTLVLFFYSLCFSSFSFFCLSASYKRLSFSAFFCGSIFSLCILLVPHFHPHFRFLSPVFSPPKVEVASSKRRVLWI